MSGIIKTLKRNPLHIEDKIKEGQLDLDIKIHHRPPKFDGVCRKNQGRYDNQRKLFDQAQQILLELA